MKNALIIVALGAFMASIASCKKCQTCEVKDPTGTVVHSTTSVCGSKKDLDAQQATCETTATTFTGSNCQCAED